MEGGKETGRKGREETLRKSREGGREGRGRNGYFWAGEKEGKE